MADTGRRGVGWRELRHRARLRGPCECAALPALEDDGAGADGVAVGSAAVHGDDAGGWGLVVDGLDIPDQPRSLFERNAFAAVPVMIGTAGDEGWNVVDRAFPAGLSAEVYRAEVEAEFGSAATPAILEHYPSTGDHLPKSTLARLVGDVEAVCEARRVARLIARSKAPVFLYSLASEPSAGEPSAPRRGLDLFFASRSAEAARHADAAGTATGSCPGRSPPTGRVSSSLAIPTPASAEVWSGLPSRTSNPRRPIPRVFLADPLTRRAEYSPGLRLLGAVLPAFRWRADSGRAALRLFPGGAAV